MHTLAGRTLPALNAFLHDHTSPGHLLIQARKRFQRHALINQKLIIC